MCLKEKNLLKKFAATLKKFSAQGAKKVEYGIHTVLAHLRVSGGIQLSEKQNVSHYREYSLVKLSIFLCISYPDISNYWDQKIYFEISVV